MNILQSIVNLILFGCVFLLYAMLKQLQKDFKDLKDKVIK